MFSRSKGALMLKRASEGEKVVFSGDFVGIREGELQAGVMARLA